MHATDRLHVRNGVNVLQLGGNLRDVNRGRDRTEIIGTVGIAFTC